MVLGTYVDIGSVLERFAEFVGTIKELEAFFVGQSLSGEGREAHETETELRDQGTVSDERFERNDRHSC